MGGREDLDGSSGLISFLRCSCGETGPIIGAYMPGLVAEFTTEHPAVTGHVVEIVHTADLESSPPRQHTIFDDRE